MAAATQWIKASGPLDARLLVVGDFCRWADMAKQQVFSGPEGFYLNQALLQEAGIPRSLVRVTNVVNTRPAGDVWYNHTAADKARGLEEFSAELGAFRGELVLALGEHALQSCVRGDPDFKPPRKATITETRGYIFQGIHGGPVLAAGHPAAMLYGGWLPGYYLFRKDVGKAGRYLKGERPATDRQQVFATDIAVVRHHVQAALADGTIAVDIEEDRCLAFSYDPKLGVAVPSYTAEPMRSAVAELLAGAERCIFQNGQYDCTRLESWGFPSPRYTDDIMLLWHAIEPVIAGKKEGGTSRTEKSLRFLVSLLTWEPFYKSYDFQSQEEEWTLNAIDARVTLEIWEKLMGMLGD